MFLIRTFVNLTPINTTRGSHSTGPKCTHLHTLLKAFVGEVLFQALVVIVGKPSTLRVERIILDQTSRHQLKNRWVDHLINLHHHTDLSTDAADVI